MSNKVAVRPQVAVEEPVVLSGTVVTHSGAELRFARLQDVLQDLHIVLIEAINADDWRTLGYPDLATWYRDATAGRSVSPQARAELALTLRQRSYSLQAIGGVLRVAKSTVAGDLDRVSNGQVIVDRVTGTDGVSYPAHHPVREIVVPRPARPPEPFYKVTVRQGGRITLPGPVCAALHVQEGDELEIVITGSGVVSLVRVPGAGSQ